MIDNNPLVSVIIPCYNTEKYIEQAVRSIMTQTYKNLEIIITDDCSKDSSYSILERLAAEDSRIKLFRNEQNMKIVKTLNFMIDQAHGKYIARMDADDISLPNRIEKQVSFLEENPDYGICGTNAWRINEKNKIIGVSLLPTESDEILTVSQFYCVFYHPSVMIRSTLYKENIYDDNYLFAEDLELWKRLLDKTKGKNLEERLFCYRLLNTSISMKSNSKTIQNNITNRICNQKDFDKLKKIKSKRLKGLIILSKMKKKETRVCKLKPWMILSVLIYVLFRVYEKVANHIIQRECDK